MIQSKKDLIEYLKADAMVYGNRKHPKLFGDERWKYVIALRKYEYYKNTRKNLFMLLFYRGLHKRRGLKLGFDIPCNVFGKGLKINHYGCIVVSPKASVGDWCDIHQCVNIGESVDNKAPQLGNNVWIGPGAKLFGDIKLGNNIMIGAGSVVNKSFEEDGVNIAGVPAKIINRNGNYYARK